MADRNLIVAMLCDTTEKLTAYSFDTQEGGTRFLQSTGSN